MMNFVYTLCSSTPGQIQYGGFKRALAKKSGNMIRHQVRILYLLFLWLSPSLMESERRYLNGPEFLKSESGIPRKMTEDKGRK